MQVARCFSAFLDYNALRRKTRKKETTMSKKTNRTFKQIIHDFFEDGALAFAMSYAVTRGDMKSVRMFEEKLR